MNGREGWAPFSYLETMKGTQSDSGVSGDGSEEEDTLSLTDSKSPSKYGMQSVYIRIPIHNRKHYSQPPYSICTVQYTACYIVYICNGIYSGTSL